MERGFETSIKFKAKKQTMEMSDYEAMLTKEVAQRGGITRDRPRSFLTLVDDVKKRSKKAHEMIAKYNNMMRDLPSDENNSTLLSTDMKLNDLLLIDSAL